MPGKRTPVGEEARAYCIRFPTASNLQLARMLHRDFPVMFPTIDNARMRVRYYRGAAGEKRRGYAKHSGSLVERELPKPEISRFKVFQLPTDARRWLILADLHIPFHDARAIEAAVEWARKGHNRCDGLLIDGDFADAYHLSAFVRDPRLRNFDEELVNIDQTLHYLQDSLRPKVIIWKAGNHEYRLEQYLKRVAPEMKSLMDFISFRKFLNLQERGVVWVNRGVPIEHRALTILHGDEWRGGSYSPVNPARTAYLKTHECTLIAHYHRSSEHTEPSIRQKTVTCWSSGCLCDLHPEYAPLNLWNQGFAVLDARKDWTIENYRIIDGEVK